MILTMTSRFAWLLVVGIALALVEVTPDKNVTWVLQDWKDIGEATAVQILDDPGIPENPGESEH